jgi:hypothetical protein
MHFDRHATKVRFRACYYSVINLITTDVPVTNITNKSDDTRVCEDDIEVVHCG